MRDFRLAGAGNGAVIYYEEGTKDSAGIKRIAKVVAGDVFVISAGRLGVRGIRRNRQSLLAEMLYMAPEDTDLVCVCTADQDLYKEWEAAGVDFGFAPAGQSLGRERFSMQVVNIRKTEAGVEVVASSAVSTESVASVASGSASATASAAVSAASASATATASAVASAASASASASASVASGVASDSTTVLLIAGSDRLGAIYGLLEISKICGMPTWCYWGDAMPKRQKQLHLPAEALTKVSKEPSVRLRGFFMNDEWPSLGNWVSNTFGDFNVDFYEQVFVLLLRMHGNFLWPAMWSASFPCDGAGGNTRETDPLANAILADELGITMSTSHHEPLMRASEEWDHVKSADNAVGYGHDWNYRTNARGLHEYWDDSVKRMGAFKNLYTLGMRGERDSKIMGDDATMLDNVNLLKDTILDQKAILAAHGLKDAPKVLALYKEVEDYFYGDETTPGLATWEELDDVLLLLSDDNFANCRTLPTAETKDRPAGWGLYYHFDYHGGPISYEWVNSTALQKVWDQMTLAYEYGIRDLWVVNVGDLRPQELPLSYFLDLAYDFEGMGSSAPNTCETYIRKWVDEQFAALEDADDLREKIAQILSLYTHMNQNRRPEVVYENTFSVNYLQEAARELKKAELIEKLCFEVFDKMDERLAPSFYGLAAFPALASANVRKMMILAGYYNLYASAGDGLANVCHALVTECIARDKELCRCYNEDMAGGKWNGMMLSNHVGFHRWNDEGWSYPQTAVIAEKDGLFVWSEDDGSSCFAGFDAEPCVLTLPSLMEGRGEELLLTVSASGTYDPDAENVEIGLSQIPEWLNVVVAPKFESELSRSIVEDELLDMVADFRACPTAFEVRISLNEHADLLPQESVKDSFKITLGTACVVVETRFEALADEAVGEDMRKVENNGYLELEANMARLTPGKNGREFLLLTEYGKTADTLRMEPVFGDVKDGEDAPKAELGFRIVHEGTYEIQLCFGPSNPVEKGCGQCFGLLLDGEALPGTNGEAVRDSLPAGFIAGDYNSFAWCRGVLENIRVVTYTAKLSAGTHSLLYIGADAGVLLQRVVLVREPD
ncbi:MAG: glycosyl hydrolase 115 family protein [Lachnospiraceae bacterium]|nr:glycosyl hydrolase 115 family protein [Lachnospiraceae bacterium]